MSAGSSVEMEQGTPAATRRGSGCSASDGTTPMRTLPIGVTSQQIRRSASSRSRPASSDGAHAVAQPVGVQRLQGAAHGGRPGQLAGVRHAAQAAGAGDGEGRRERLGREGILRSAQSQPDDAAVAVADGPARDLLRPPRAGSCA